MIRELEKNKAVHVVGESASAIFAVVLDPHIYRVVFGLAGKSEVLIETNLQMNDLLAGNCKNISREVRGDQVTAIIITPFNGKILELHPNCLSAADAYEAHVRKKSAETEQSKHSA